MGASAGNGTESGHCTAPRQGQLQERRFKAKVYFEGDGVRMVVAQPADSSAAERRAYNTAHRQCTLHLVSEAPTLFNVSTSGNLSWPVTEVHVKAELLQKLPLLQDVSKSTADVESEPKRRRTSLQNAQEENQAHDSADIALPCSVWGLVSVLLQLQGAVGVDQWFDSGKPESDAALPAQTLEVRCKWYQRHKVRCCCVHVTPEGV
jgi:hypothetical protein